MYEGVLMTNGFENDYNGTTARALYPTLSLASHSCIVSNWAFWVICAFLFIVTKVFGTNSDFLISISPEPNVVDLRYFKLLILVD